MVCEVIILLGFMYVF